MNRPAKQVYQFGPFHLDAVERLLLRDGAPVPLAPKVFDTLLALVENSGHLIEKGELMERLWPDTFVEEATLARNISDLRKALSAGANTEKYIETVPKRGYRFVAIVENGWDETAELVFERHRRTRIVTEEDGQTSVQVELDQVAIEAPDSDQKRLSLPAPAALPRLSALARRWPLAMGAVSVALLALLIGLNVGGWRERLFGRATPPRIESLAVLPLDNLSGDSSQDYFVDGMTDALITELGKIGTLRVISRTSVMQYKGTREMIPEIARKLKVDAVVEGSVLRSGERVGITVNLIYAATDQRLWGDRYERGMRDLLSLQSEVAHRIVSEIRVKLTPQEETQLANTPLVNPEAYEAYLKGRFFWYQAINKTTLEERTELSRKSLDYFEQAIKIEPNYAEAYAGLAQSYHYLASGSNLSIEFYPKAKAAAMKAIEIDKTLADAHGALAFTLHRLDYDWVGAEGEYRRTIELDPNSGYRHGYGLYLSAAGRHQKAIAEMKRAMEIDPHTLPLRVNLGYVYINARDYDSAIEQFKICLNLAPNFPELHAAIGEAYVDKEMYEEGIAEIQRAVELTGGRGYKPRLAWAYAKSGKRNKAIKILDEVGISKQQPVAKFSISPLTVAAVYAALDQRDQAMVWLDKAFEMRVASILDINCLPDFDTLRSHLPFQDLLRRIGLAR